MDITEVKAIHETSDWEEVNHYLKEGWILLDVGFHTSEEPGFERRSYSLGFRNDLPF